LTGLDYRVYLNNGFKHESSQKREHLMTSKRDSIQKKIIYATLKCIEKTGVHAVTVRDIAKEAQVNSAAINYYFGSKDNLLDTALKSAIEHYFSDVAAFFEKKNLDARAILRAFFTYSLNGIMMYPGVTKAYLYDPFVHNNYEGMYIKQLNVFLESFTERFKIHVTKKSKDDIVFSMIHMISAIILPGLFPGLFHDFAGIDFTNMKSRKEYINHLVDHYSETFGL
jgi:AcrR family transcriptional regulator